MRVRPPDAVHPRRWGIGHWAVFGLALLAMAGLAFLWTADRFIEREGHARDPHGQCPGNLKLLGEFLVERAAAGKLTRYRGQGFLLQLARIGMIRPQDVRVFACPRDPDRARWDDPGFMKKFQSIDPENPEPGLTSYAVRDFRSFPVPPDADGKQPWVLCPWHEDVIPVLYDDGSVALLRREELGVPIGMTPVLGPEAKNGLLKMFLPVQR